MAIMNDRLSSDRIVATKVVVEDGKHEIKTNAMNARTVWIAGRSEMVVAHRTGSDTALPQPCFPAPSCHAG
jgi:hypothetical protein